MNDQEKPDLPDLPENLPQTKKTDAGGTSRPAIIEDAGTRALSDALSSSFKIIKVLMVILVIVFIGSGIFTVEPNEVAVVLRFGKPVGSGDERLLTQGLHWAFPKPIDEKVFIPIGELMTIEATNSWYRETDDMKISGTLPSALPSLSPAVDGYALTSDGNIIHARATAKYRIGDPIQYSFSFLGITNLIENALNNALVYAAAGFTAHNALYSNPAGFRDRVRQRFFSTVNTAQLGIQLEPLEVRTFPPMFVKQAFDNVLQAEQTRSQTINKARGEADAIVRKAAGEAQAVISKALTRSNILVQTISADAEYFKNQLAIYKNNPDTLTSRLLIETMEQVGANAEDLWFLPRGSDEVRIQLNREPTSQSSEEEESAN